MSQPPQDPPQHFTDAWPKPLRDALETLCEEAIDDPCIDNWRYARKSNAEEVAQFEAIEQQGCCGFYHAEAEVDGDTVLYGFNYGH